MISEPLTMQHRSSITTRLKTIGMHLSEFSFPNLYLFRNTHQYQVVSDDKELFITGITYDKKKYLMPLSKPQGQYCLEHIKDLLLTGEWDFIFPIPEEWLNCFDQNKYQSDYSLDDSDYLYYTEKFTTYPGKKMHKKKNLLNQFLKIYEHRVETINENNLNEALQILDIWQHTSPQELATSDFNQCLEALKLRNEFNLLGFLVFADQKPAGFILGEPLNIDTMTIHFAKANIIFKGIYQYMFSHFAKKYSQDYKYINQEQDMGKLGLRKTKVSYRPDLMAHKYRISLK